MVLMTEIYISRSLWTLLSFSDIACPITTHGFLISLAPNGVISFISKGWGGRVSDKVLTENCGILKNLLPGDEILADRGFNIEDSVGYYGASLKMPPFTRGKKQLSAKEVHFARKLSNCRIHVERIISQLKQKYTVFSSTVPIAAIKCDDDSGLSLMDKIAVIACALCNCCASIVPTV